MMGIWSKTTNLWWRFGLRQQTCGGGLVYNNQTVMEGWSETTNQWWRVGLKQPNCDGGLVKGNRPVMEGLSMTTNLRWRVGLRKPTLWWRIGLNQPMVEGWSKTTNLWWRVEDMYDALSVNNRLQFWWNSSYMIVSEAGGMSAVVTGVVCPDPRRLMVCSQCIIWTFSLFGQIIFNLDQKSWCWCNEERFWGSLWWKL